MSFGTRIDTFTEDTAGIDISMKDQTGFTIHEADNRQESKIGEFSDPDDTLH